MMLAEATPPAQLAAELPRRVTAFYAGDERYAGQWLTEFQRAEGAWFVCIEALRPGPLPTCDEELLQEFCSQTLARLARTFGGRFGPEEQPLQREELALLLDAHVGGQRVVWKQLALALTCADLWLGIWAPPAMDWPEPLRKELLSQPVDLLFCDRALPIDSARVRQAAAASLLESCGLVFEDLLSFAGDGEVSCLDTVAAWLAALRKALRLLPAHDEAGPLHALSLQSERLVALACASPRQAAPVAQELARWGQLVGDTDVAPMLEPILQAIFGSAGPDDCRALLPLFTELAAGCWPRAALGDSPLDWQAIAGPAVSALRVAVQAAGEPNAADEGGEAAADAEVALSVWQTFAATVRDGTRAPEQSLAEKLPDVEKPEGAGPNGARPEKRSRVREEAQWRATPERIAACEALPLLFGGLARTLLEVLRLPDEPIDLDVVRPVLALREAAESAVAAWAALVSSEQAWAEATRQPLEQACAPLVGLVGGEGLPDEAWAEVEVALWLTAVLAQSRRTGAGTPESCGQEHPAAALYELGGPLDAAQEPWRTWLWAAAARLAGAAPREHCTRLIEWLLRRSPWGAFAPECLELTELPYAEALERLCRQLPVGVPHVAVGEQLAALAFADRPPGAAHAGSVQAQGLMLQAMRAALGCDSALLCNGLAQRVLPVLCRGTEAEAEEAGKHREPQWRAAQVLFATLVAALPPAGAPVVDPAHPALLLWRERWPFVEAALVHWPLCAETDQPVACAAEALTSAVAVLPGLLPEALDLLVRSAGRHEVPDIQLQAVRKVVNGVRCPPVDAPCAAALLSNATVGIVDAQLAKMGDLLQSPDTLAALFDLLADAIRPSPPGTAGAGACGDQLRPRLLAQCALVGRCLSLAALAVRDSLSASASAATLRFLAHLAGGEDAAPEEVALRPMLVATLPEVCASLCQALASLQHYTELDQSLVAAADFLLRAATAMPAELPVALAAGAGTVHGTSTGLQLQRHVTNRAAWPKKGEWLEELQHIVCEWQREHRRVQH